MPPRPKSQNQQELEAVRALPHAVGAEKSVISCILQEPAKFIPLALSLRVTVDDFYLPAHQTLLARIYKLHAEGHEVELISLVQHLLDNGELDRVGGPGAVTDIYSYAVGGQHLKSHVAMLRAKRALRLTVQMGNEVITEAYDAPAELDNLADTIERRTEQIMTLIADPFNDKAKLTAQIVTFEEVMPEIERILHSDELLGGDPFFMPRFPVGFRKRESTLWFGLSGHGKSNCLQNLTAHMVCMDRKIALASLEQPSASTYTQILKALTGDPLIGYKPHLQRAMRWLMDRVFIYKGMDRVVPRTILEFFRQCYLEHGVSHVITDNVMTLKIARGDNDAQAEAADEFRVFTSNHDLHNHLVAHPRKPGQELSTKHNGYPPPPTLYDINGAGEWGNMPNNVIVVWRDMIKADAIAQRELTQSKAEVKVFHDSTPCGKCVTRKQRAGGKLPTCVFLFDEPTGRFQAYPNPGPVGPIYGDHAPWD